VLRIKPLLLDAQREAAETYQAWAAKDPEQYRAAIEGAYSQKNPRTGRQENIIQGWSRLALTVQRHPNLQDTFYEARYNLAKCLYEYGMTTKLGAAVKKDSLENAEKAILVTAQLR